MNSTPGSHSSRETLLRLRRRQKLERVLESFCGKAGDLVEIRRRWVAAQNVLALYDSDHDFSEDSIHAYQDMILKECSQSEVLSTEQNGTSTKDISQNKLLLSYDEGTW